MRSSMTSLHMSKPKVLHKRSISVLHNLASTYNKFPKHDLRRPSIQLNQITHQNNHQEDEHVQNTEWKEKVKALCQKLVFQMIVFKKMFKESRRKKLVLQKLYGWDQETFSPLFFIKDQQELKPDLTPELIWRTLGLKSLNKNSKNLFNKLRLFLSSLSTFIVRQQQLQTKYLRERLDVYYLELQRQISEIKMGKSKALKDYGKQMADMHFQMKGAKLRIKNKVASVQQIQQKLGKIKINPFYLKEQQNADDLQQFIKGK